MSFFLRETRFLTRRICVFSNFCNTRRSTKHAHVRRRILPPFFFSRKLETIAFVRFYLPPQRSFSSSSFFFRIVVFPKTKSDRVLKFSYQDTRNFCFFFFSLATSLPRRKIDETRGISPKRRFPFVSSSILFAGKNERRFTKFNEQKEKRRAEIVRYNELINVVLFSFVFLLTFAANDNFPRPPKFHVNVRSREFSDLLWPLLCSY